MLMVHPEICHHYPGGMAACMHYAIDAMSLCKSGEIARILLAKVQQAAATLL